MKTLYFDCASGISGDMTVAALLDLGASRQALLDGLTALGVGGYRLEFGRAVKSGVDTFDFRVIPKEDEPHGFAYEHGHAHTHNDAHAHSHNDAHTHEHGHAHIHSHADVHTHDAAHAHPPSHAHEHRTFADIRAIIENAALSAGVKDMALRIFRAVAEAEGKVHGKPADAVHFHEVGAVDSIVDIVGTAILLDDLAVDKILCSPLSEGRGTVRCRHGVMPVPAPATLEIARAHGIPLRTTENQGEMVTPTGAAIVAAVARGFGAPPAFTVLAVGYGAGKREFAHTANLLRVLLVEEEAENSAGDAVCELACNLDDITGEALGFACETLLEAGALDVWVTPATMKKGRPGHILSLLCPCEREAVFSRLMLLHTSTIGVRSSRPRRVVMERRAATVQTPFGAVEVKESVLEGINKTKVEYESARTIARERGVPLGDVLAAAYDAIAKKRNERG